MSCPQSSDVETVFAVIGGVTLVVSVTKIFVAWCNWSLRS